MTEGKTRATQGDDDAELAAQLIERRLAPERIAFDGLIDRGGMGLIERVRDLHLDREMARKVLAPRLAEDPKSVRYFLREAWITARLAHPAVVPVHELGLDERGRLNFTMKLVDGEHLGQRVRGRGEGPMSQEELFEFLNVVLRVCEALELAHAHGVVHRDLKPDNVMVGAFGAVYLMDWGVAGSVEGGDPIPADLEVDDRGAAVGTPAYMAPEQATGVEADRRTDVYGVGGLIYFILTRKAPHRGKAIMEVLQQAAYEPVTPPRELVPDHPIPKALEDIVLKALAYEPKARHGSIAELASELRRFMRGGGDFPRMRVQKGQHVVRLGEAGDAAYIIVSGRLEVYREVEGARQRFRVMTRGEVFGEMAILGSGIRTANVVALEDAELLVVTRETLQREVGDMKPWVGAIVRTLARRFEQRERELVEASRPSTRRQPSLPEARRVLQLVLMLCEGWCERKREGDAIQLRWSTLANEVDALMQIERAQLANILGAREEFTIDVEADLISLRGAAALRNRLRHAL